MKRFICCIGILLCVLFLPVYCRAISFSVDPQRIEYSAGLGEEFDGVYTIKNPELGYRMIEIDLRKWPEFKNNPEIEVSDWLKMETTAIILKPMEEKKIKYKVKVPAKGVNGELMGMPYFLVKPYNPNELKAKKKEGLLETKMGASLTISIGTSIYVVVKETAKMEAELGEMGIIKQFSPDEYGGSKHIITVELLNKGNVHLRPLVTAKLVNLDKKKEIYSQEKKESGVVFGNLRSGCPIMLDTLLPQGRYKVDVVVEFKDTTLPQLKSEMVFKIGEKGNIEKELPAVKEKTTADTGVKGEGQKRKDKGQRNK